METAVRQQSQRLTPTKYPCFHHHHHLLHHHLPHQHHHHHHLHHHHHHHHHHHCALHCRPHFCPRTPTLTQNLQPIASLKDVKPSVSHEPSNSVDLMLQEEEQEGLEEEEDEEPVFVLTDEWMEFFAKSEAKRRLEKKQAKKHKN